MPQDFCCGQLFVFITNEINSKGVTVFMHDIQSLLHLNYLDVP